MATICTSNHLNQEASVHLFPGTVNGESLAPLRIPNGPLSYLLKQSLLRSLCIEHMETILLKQEDIRLYSPLALLQISKSLSSMLWGNLRQWWFLIIGFFHSYLKPRLGRGCLSHTYISLGEHRWDTTTAVTVLQGLITFRCKEKQSQA